MVDIIEQPLDVEFQYPIVFPAPLPGHRYRIQRRFPRSIAVGVMVKVRLYLGLKIDFRHHLGHPITYRGDSQQACPATLLGDCNRFHGWGKVAAGGHPVPDLVQVVLQVGFESCQALSVDACHPLVGFYFSKGF